MLQGFQLVERNYWPLPNRSEPDGGLRMHSAVLGLELRVAESELRFHDPATGQKLHSHAEAEQARQQAEARAEREAAQRQALEARLAELEARLRG